MAIPYSGTVPHRSNAVTITGGLDYYTEIRSALLAAGWNEFYHVGNKSRFRSMKTPQGLQAAVEVAYGPEVGWGTDASQVTWMSADGADRPSMSFMMTNTRGNHVNFRVIANGYQFFTYSDSDQTFTGGVVMGGVPWIPDVLKPFSIVSVDNDDPIRVTVDRDVDVLSGQYVMVDGVTSYSGLRGSWQSNILSPREVELVDTSGSGVYNPNECVLAGPYRLARCIWGQSCTYAAGWLFSDISETLRWKLESNAAVGGLSLGLDRCGHVGFINQFYNIVNADFSNSSFTSASRIHAPLLNKPVYGTKYVMHEAFLKMGDSTVLSIPVIMGMLWDAAILSTCPGTDTDVLMDDGNFWKIYGWSVTPSHGSLLLYLGGT